MESIRAEFAIDAKAIVEGKIRVLAEDARIRFLSLARTRLSVLAQDRTYSIELERAEFETASTDLLRMTNLLAYAVLAAAGRRAADIDGVIAVGSSTRIRMVGDYLGRLAGGPQLVWSTSTSGGVGASLLAARKQLTVATGVASRRVHDVTSHSLGMKAVDSNADRYIDSIILPKGAATPSRQSRPYRLRTVARKPNPLEVFATQGEQDSPSEVDFVGRYVVDGIAYARGSPLIITLTTRTTKATNCRSVQRCAAVARSPGAGNQLTPIS